MGNHYNQNDPKEHAIENDDRYYAQILQIYGDSDESARQTQQHNHRQAQQQYYEKLQQQYNQQPKADSKVEVRIYLSQARSSSPLIIKHSLYC